jgi:hypothetical protein
MGLPGFLSPPFPNGHWPFYYTFTFGSSWSASFNVVDVDKSGKFETDRMLCEKVNKKEMKKAFENLVNGSVKILTPKTTSDIFILFEGKKGAKRGRKS